MPLALSSLTTETASPTRQGKLVNKQAHLQQDEVKCGQKVTNLMALLSEWRQIHHHGNRTYTQTLSQCDT